ncbi:MAG: diacylglycerol kinase family protein [Candidatus Methanoperedens sp.]|nr:diacylglycerol kinase family protein [Candidatus Methanoperedens sp.]
MERTQFNIRNLGVIANPEAGAGTTFIEKITAKAIEKFSYCDIIHSNPVGRKGTMLLAAQIAPIVDAILVVGGDGTMSDVAYSLFASGATTPILGIGAGSTNAGPLITSKAKDIDNLIPNELFIREVPGILADLNGEHKGLGFNDIVLGDTILTTLKGKVVQVSAQEFMNGKKISAPPSRVGTVNSNVIIERKGTIKLIHRGEFGQMFASPLEERYQGKGLAGGTSLASALCLPAGIAISNEPLINYSIEQDEFLEMEPITTKTASFREGDEVVIRELKEGTCLNIDGNPVSILENNSIVRLRYIPSAARVLKN